jgi:hypothetical protein
MPCTNNETCNCSEPLIVAVGSGGKLEFNGHTVSNGDILCTGTGSCKLTGTGTLNDAHVIGGKNLRLTDVTIQGAGPDLRSAIVANGKLSLTDVDLVQTAGVAAQGTARLTRVTITDTLLVAPYVALQSGGLAAKNLTIAGTGNSAVRSYNGRLTLKDSSIAPDAGSVTNRRGSLSLVATSVGVVISSQKPALRNGATCVGSQRLDKDGFYIEGNWGVCDLD